MDELRSMSSSFRRTRVLVALKFLRYGMALVIALAAPWFAVARAGATTLPTLVAQSYPQRATPSQAATPGPAAKDSSTRPVARTEQYTLSQERYDKAVALSRTEYILYFVSAILGIVVLWIVLRAGVAAKFRDVAERISGRRVVQSLIFVPLLILTLDLFDLPVHIYGHVLSLRYEQSVQRWGSWIWDWCKGEMLTVGLATGLVLLLFALMRWSPRRWWLYFWFATLPILLFLILIQPWFVDPIFNKFEPLQGKYPELVAAIESVVQRTNLNIPPERMFLMHASAKTNEINAYVTGLGASKRVVVWDTTIQKMSTDETLFVFGHEAGHYVLHHLRNGIIFFAVIFFVALYVAFRALHWSLDRWGKEWKIYGPEDWASLAVLLLLLNIMIFVSMPITSGFSRMQEHAADVFGLEVIHGLVPDSPEVAAHAFQVLGEIDLADPNPSPIITIWLYSHPPLAERLVFAHIYDPWSKGESPKYVKSEGGSPK
jgi:STE24 endopeptidase